MEESASSNTCTLNNAHKTAHIELYIGNIFAEKIAHITAICNITDYKIVVIVAVIRAVYRLPAKCIGYMGLVWADRRNNTHTLPITQQLWVVLL